MIRDTSLEAYKSVDLQKNEQIVLDVIKKIGPCSNLDIANFLGWPVNRVTGRTNGLYRKEMIKDHDKQKQNGRNVLRWRANDVQLNMFK